MNHSESCRKFSMNHMLFHWQTTAYSCFIFWVLHYGQRHLILFLVTLFFQMSTYIECYSRVDFLQHYPSQHLLCQTSFCVTFLILCETRIKVPQQQEHQQEKLTRLADTYWILFTMDALRHSKHFQVLIDNFKRTMPIQTVSKSDTLTHIHACSHAHTHMHAHTNKCWLKEY